MMAIAASAAVAHPADPAAAVHEVLLQNVAAFERGDYAATERLWAHGDEVSVFESGYANYGWADYRDHTAVLEKRSGERKIVHWHTSAPRKKP